MKSSAIDDSKSLCQLAMIAAYKGMATSKAAANSLGMEFVGPKVERLAEEFKQDREEAMNTLFEESMSRMTKLSSLIEQATKNVNAYATDDIGISQVITSFKELVIALGQKAAIEVSSLLAAALFQPVGIGGLAGATRTDFEENAKPTENLKWRLALIEDEMDTPRVVRLTISTDLPADEIVEFVVFGVNDASYEMLENKKSDGNRVVASDTVFELWSGSIEVKHDDHYVEITFEMPENLKITDHNSHYNTLLQQDSQRVFGVILKVFQ